MELLQLQYFCELAATEHLTETANKLMISPSSLSHTIKRLEGELGVPLFDHSGRRIYLNQYGELFYRHAQNALNELNAGKRFVLEKKKEQSSVFVGMTNLSIWEMFLARFQEAYPNINLILHIAYGEEDLHNLTSKLDFFLGDVNDLPSDVFNWHPLLPEEYPVIAANINHPCAKNETLDFRSLANETFFSVQHAHFSSHRWQEKIFHLAGLNLNEVNFIVGNLVSRIKALQNNRCIAVTTKRGIASNFLNFSEIVAIPLSFPVVIRQQGIFWKKSATAFSPALEAFFNFAALYFVANDILETDSYHPI